MMGLPLRSTLLGLVLPALGSILGCQEPMSTRWTDLAGCESYGTDAAFAQIFADQIDSHLSALEPYGFSGAVWIAQGRCAEYQYTYGYADVFEQRPVTPHTAFSLASVPKFMTSAAIHSLAAEGQLDIEAPVSRYLPQMPADKRAITIRHLLEHRSGLQTDYWDQHRELATQDAYVAMMLERPLVSEPGARFAYNNFGFLVLKLLIEEVSGQSYESYLRSAVLDPLQIDRLGFDLPDWSDGDIAFYQSASALRWSQSFGQDLTNPLQRPIYFQVDGGGGLLGDASSVGRFMHRLANDTPFDWALEDLAPRGNRNGFGAGLRFRPSSEGLHLYHGGFDTSLGIIAMVGHVRERDLTYVILANTHLNRTLTSNTLSASVDAILSRRPLASPIAAPAAGVAADRFIGTWALEGVGRFDLQRDDAGRLTVVADNPISSAVLTLPGLADPSGEPPSEAILQFLTALQTGDRDQFRALAAPGYQSDGYFDQVAAQWTEIKSMLGTSRGFFLIHGRDYVRDGQVERWHVLGSVHDRGVYPIRIVDVPGAGLIVLTIEMDTPARANLAPVGPDTLGSWNDYLQLAVSYTLSGDDQSLVITDPHGAQLQLARVPS